MRVEAQSDLLLLRLLAEHLELCEHLLLLAFQVFVVVEKAT